MESHVQLDPLFLQFLIDRNYLKECQTCREKKYSFSLTMVGISEDMIGISRDTPKIMIAECVKCKSKSEVPYKKSLREYEKYLIPRWLEANKHENAKSG